MCSLTSGISIPLRLLRVGEIQHGIFSGAKFVRVEARNTSDQVLAAMHLVGSLGWVMAASPIGQQ